MTASLSDLALHRRNWIPLRSICRRARTHAPSSPERVGASSPSVEDVTRTAGWLVLGPREPNRSIAYPPAQKSSFLGPDCCPRGPRRTREARSGSPIKGGDVCRPRALRSLDDLEFYSFAFTRAWATRALIAVLWTGTSRPPYRNKAKAGSAPQKRYMIDEYTSGGQGRRLSMKLSDPPASQKMLNAPATRTSGSSSLSALYVRGIYGCHPDRIFSPGFAFSVMLS